jgi:transcriptional regulator with XRE-family HTH domain
MSRKKMPIPDGFPRRLHELRNQKNLSQTQLAQQVGLHYTHLGRYERGEARPTADALKRLADALGVTGDYLLEGSTQDVARARFEDRELLIQFQKVEKLPQEDKELVKKILDAFLVKKQLEDLLRRAPA